jgi:hypothetical protein
MLSKFIEKFYESSQFLEISHISTTVLLGSRLLNFPSSAKTHHQTPPPVGTNSSTDGRDDLEEQNTHLI